MLKLRLVMDVFLMLTIAVSLGQAFSVVVVVHFLIASCDLLTAIIRVEGHAN
jgi:hypothetical protein